MAGRRELTFTRLEDVPADVEGLLAGHVTVGQWSLGQILNHLATGIRLTMEGRPAPAEPTREQDVARRRFFRAGKFPEGVAAPFPILLPEPGLVSRTEADALAMVIDRFASAAGPFAAHPILGPLTKDEWTQFHCMHCVHHLSFASRDRG